MMHLPKSMILFVLIILLSLATWKSALAQVVPRESMLGARSIAALAHDVRLGQSWPRLERSVPKDRQFARALIVKFRSEHQEVFVAPDSDTIMHYADLIGAMKTSGGYLNTVTKDTLYRLAINDIAGLMVQHPERWEEASKLLELVQPGPWDSGEIGKLFGEASDPAFEKDFASWPPTEVFMRLLKHFNRGPFSIDGRSSAIINGGLPLDLALRAMSTDLVVRYSLPGLIAYARMGGDVRKITDSNVSEVGRIMGRDVYRYSYPLLNLNELLGVHVLNLIKQFGDPKQASTFLTDALN